MLRLALPCLAWAPPACLQSLLSFGYQTSLHAGLLAVSCEERQSRSTRSHRLPRSCALLSLAAAPCLHCLLACIACCLAVLPVFIIRHSRAMMLGGGILPPHSGSTGQSVIISSSVCSCYYSAIAALDCNCEGLESAASHFYWQPPVSQWWSHADASHALTHDSCHAVAGSAASVGS